MDRIIDWIAAGRVTDIPRQGARVLHTAHGPVAVFRTHDDGVFAMEDRCPHRGGPLSEGIVHGHSVTCPLHNWVIDLETGMAKAPDKGCSHSLPVSVVDGEIRVGWVAAPDAVASHG